MTTDTPSAATKPSPRTQLPLLLLTTAAVVFMMGTTGAPYRAR